MTKLLAEAFAQIERHLADDDQDALAATLLAGLTSELKIDALIGSRPEVLDALADEALDEFSAGRTLPLDVGR